MASDRLRRLLAMEAAKLIYSRAETQYGPARNKAIRQLVAGPIDPADLPGNREIRACVRDIARCNPVQREEMLMELAADRSLGRPTAAGENTVDRFRTYELLLLPLEYVDQSPDEHPEGDVLYHSLQVFELARQQLPYDEEFLLAALLHDVGKGIDRRDHVAAGLTALQDAVGPRTAWLIEHHVEALMYRTGELGARLRRRLETAEDFADLMLLAECDRRGRQVGMAAPDVPEALDYIRTLAAQCETD